jgi:hypothetical protein
VRKRTSEIRGAFSNDGGVTWTSFASEPPGNGGGQVTITADGATIVWTPWQSRPYFTRDGGKTWTACHGLREGMTVTADRVSAQKLYAFDDTTGAVMVSDDHGATFSAHATNLPIASRTSGGFGGGGASGVSLHPVPGRAGMLWLASRQHGLRVSSDAGKTFTTFPDVKEAYSLGFGKAAPGREWPALYLFGKIAGTTGLFRSDDSGAGWTRINDDLHQFGWLNHVTGDPRIYGRVYFATGGRGIFFGEPGVSH